MWNAKALFLDHSPERTTMTSAQAMLDAIPSEKLTTVSFVDCLTRNCFISNSCLLQYGGSVSGITSSMAQDLSPSRFTFRRHKHSCSRCPFVLHRSEQLVFSVASEPRRCYRDSRATSFGQDPSVILPPDRLHSALYAFRDLFGRLGKGCCGTRHGWRL